MVVHKTCHALQGGRGLNFCFNSVVGRTDYSLLVKVLNVLGLVMFTYEGMVKFTLIIPLLNQGFHRIKSEL